MSDREVIPEIQDAIRRKYGDVSTSAAGRFNYPTGREGAILQGYDGNIVASLRDEMVDSFCGVGNPFKPGPLNPGERVLDVGCGAGFDMIIASFMVGQRGKVCGIDITLEMAEKAKKNLFEVALSDFDVKVASAESIPYDDNAFEVVISNGVLNLSPSKEKALGEIFRVLKPKGRLQFADIVRKESCLTQGENNTLESWSS